MNAANTSHQALAREQIAPSAEASHLAGRVMAMCDHVANQTEVPGEITRRYLCQPAHRVHDLIRSWMDEVGLDCRVDGAGNLIVRKDARDSKNSSRTLLIGSHVDTVPNAGKYDGVLGVMIGLAALEALRDHALELNVDVIALSEEEGVRFRQPYLGSAAICGRFDPEWLDRMDENGVTMASAMQRFGLKLSDLDRAAYSPENVVGYIEAHIEQGPVLASLGSPVGTVDAIVGQSRLLVRFRGCAGHAGTTPMELRHDALVTAAKWIDQVDQIAKATSGLRMTVGQCSVSPGVRNVIPEQCDLSLDVRHADDGVREGVVKNVLEIGHQLANAADLCMEITESEAQPAVLLDKHLKDALDHSLVEAGLPTHSLSSGAGHDAAMMSSTFPSAMLFVRQPKGISHHPDEDVDIRDVAIAIHVMTSAISRISSLQASP